MKQFVILLLVAAFLCACSSEPPTWLIQMRHDPKYEFSDYTSALRNALKRVNDRYEDVSTVSFRSQNDGEFFIGIVSRKTHPRIRDDLLALILVMPDGSRIELRHAAIAITEREQ